MIYLALGRPVLQQDTAWAEVFLIEAGQLPFTNIEEGAAGIERIEADYEVHSSAATALADGVFSADQVIGTLLNRLS